MSEDHKFGFVKNGFVLPKEKFQEPLGLAVENLLGLVFDCIALEFENGKFLGSKVNFTENREHVYRRTDHRSTRLEASLYVMGKCCSFMIT